MEALHQKPATFRVVKVVTPVSSGVFKPTGRTDASATKKSRRRQAANSLVLYKWGKGSAEAAVKKSPPPTDLLTKVWVSVSDESRKTFVAAVTERPVDGLDESLWGPAPTSEERQSAALEQIAGEFARRSEVISKSLTAPQAARILNVSSQAVRDRIESGDLIGLRNGREWRLPSWQFNAEAETGYVAGINRVRQQFPGGPVALSRWAVKPNPDLHDETPAQALAEGNVDTVVRAAEATTSAAW